MGATVEIRLMGPVRVFAGDAEIALPRSRKVRALLAFLALEQAPSSRSRLCDLLWDVPNDPRGELRWCLSKLRSVLDDEEKKRVVTTGQSLVALDLTGCRVDAIELDRITSTKLADVPTGRLLDIADRASGDFLDGMQVDGPELTGWLVTQRERLRAKQIAILAELTTRAEPGSDEMFRRLESWLGRAPFDRRAHETMIGALVKSGRHREAEAHVAATIRAFEREGVDWAPLREAWQATRRVTVVESVAATVAPAVEEHPRPARHGSIVVMPFTEGIPGSSQIANGLTDDIITRLAKLRVLFVIARGTAYALRERGIASHEAGRILDVDYVVDGIVRRHGGRLSVVVELSSVRDGRIVWTEELDVVTDETFEVLDSIVDRIVAGISDEIERAETKRAVVKPPSSLDAWEAYHRGLWHMYKFNGADNDEAARFFRHAVGLDATFSRAHAGLSFTHFQNVFLGLTQDREAEIGRALESAGQSVAADDRDPAAHWAMGRALWLRGDGESIAELERSIELSPNFALGHYMLGFVHAQSGDPKSAIGAADHSRALSPFDPLQFAMLGSRALAHMRLGQRDEAAEFAVKAASRPNAHLHMLAIAAVNLALANRRDQAREVVARLRAKLPGYSVEDFLRAFRFDADAAKMIRVGAKDSGFA